MGRLKRLLIRVGLLSEPAKPKPALGKRLPPVAGLSTGSRGRTHDGRVVVFLGRGQVYLTEQGLAFSPQEPDR